MHSSAFLWRHFGTKNTRSVLATREQIKADVCPAGSGSPSEKLLKTLSARDFPGGPVVKTLSSQCGGVGGGAEGGRVFDVWLGTKISVLQGTAKRPENKY